MIFVNIILITTSIVLIAELNHKVSEYIRNRKY